MASAHGPRRIVCLTPETVDVLYRLGQSERIAGISGFTVHPTEARRSKPKVSAFTTARIDRILDLRPDLVLGFSDLQADLAAELVRHGVEVHVFNQRDVDGILRMIATLGRLVDAPEEADRLVSDLEARLADVSQRAAALPVRPRVYFEEWDDPMICGINWVSELIGIAGGEDVFAERARKPDARSRILADPTAVTDANPQLIVGSWCGKKFRPEKVAARDGFERVEAVTAGRLCEIKSADILQPGPIAIERGLEKLHEFVREAAYRRVRVTPAAAVP